MRIQQMNCARLKQHSARLLLLGLLTPFNPAVADPDQLSIGISVSDLGNPYFVQIAKGAEQKAHQLAGENISVKVVSSAYDLERQIAQINHFVEQKVDIILLSAATYEGVETAITRARKAGVKVLAVDVKAKGADATVTTDNVQAGEIACQHLVTKLNGKGRVVIINGPPVSSIKDRVQGCKQVLSQAPGIELISSDQNGSASQTGGLESMTYLLIAYGQIDGVFAINDPSAVGAVQAVRQAGLSNILVVSVDGAPVAEQEMQNPDSGLIATAAQFPRQLAASAVEIGYRLMQGETLEDDLFLVPAELVTPDTVQHYKGW